MGGKVREVDGRVDVAKLIEKWDSKATIAETATKSFDGFVSITCFLDSNIKCNG